jgi:hypothetical protein
MHEVTLENKPELPMKSDVSMESDAPTKSDASMKSDFRTLSGKQAHVNLWTRKVVVESDVEVESLERQLVLKRSYQKIAPTLEHVLLGPGKIAAMDMMFQCPQST